MIKRKHTVKKRTVKAVKVLKERDTAKAQKSFDFTLNTIMDYIRTRAYYIWEDLGKPQGKDNDIWHKAEKDILSKLVKKR